MRKYSIKHIFCSALLGSGLMLALTACHTPTRSNADFERINALRQSGIEAYEAGDYKEAEGIFAQAMEDCGKLTDELYLDLCKYYGTCLYEQGDYENAIKAYQDLEKKAADPGSLSDIYYLEGCCYIALDDENSAAIEFEAALKNGNNDYSTYCSMYEKFMEAGYVERAESYLKRLISAEDSSDMLVGKTYYNLGRYTDAESYLLKALDQGEEEANYYVPLNYEAKEEYMKAEEFYQSFLQKNPQDATAHNQYGAYLMRRGRYEAAITVIEEGLELDNLGEARQYLYYNQAVCYEYLLDFGKAYTLFSEYVKLYPEDQAALRELEFLKTRA